ncbi:phosphoserine phosphatase, chloroplastic-like isoform X1 [Miscanthus floridulus]|uniref:phosphoserine phosphatase, chloroplastic-like isoform X1 n=2 Tax=Miscanthus floridulus TaxID=154761 RepID=UPI003458F862
MAQLPVDTTSSWSGISGSRNSVGPRSPLRFKSPDAGAHGMADLICLRAGLRSSPSLPRSSSTRAPPPASQSQVTVRFTSPLFCCAKLCKSRPLLAAALEVSKDGSSADLANSLPCKGAVETLRSADAVCFDVDSTVILDEGIDELADFCGAGKAVAEWTAKAMTGTVPFEEALAARLSLIKPSLSQVEECLKKRPPRISPGMADLVKKLKSNNIDVFLVSGGFRQMIKPVAFELGIPPENIIANQLLFGTSGEYAGFDPAEPTSRSGGKAKAVQQIKKDRGYKIVVMIGDGATDLEARQPGGADLFICYAGVQMREPVAAEADWVVFYFQELITKLP